MTVFADDCPIGLRRFTTVFYVPRKRSFFQTAECELNKRSYCLIHNTLLWGQSNIRYTQLSAAIGTDKAVGLLQIKVTRARREIPQEQEAVDVLARFIPVFRGRRHLAGRLPRHPLPCNLDQAPQGLPSSGCEAMFS